MNRDIPFVDKNNERRYLIMRAMRIKDDLRGRIFSDSIDTGDFEYRPGQVNTEDENSASWTVFGENDFWGERELYAQFRQSVTVPAEFAGKKIVYDVTCFPHTGWHSSCQQFILKVDGEIKQGIDHNHTFAVLSDCAEAGRKYDIFLNAYFDDNEFRGKSQLRAKLRVLEPAVSDVYYDMNCLWDAAHVFDADDINRVEIVKAMNEACNILELNSPDRDEFIASCKKAGEWLHKNIFGAKNDILMSAIGHTHIDVAWRWRLRQTREKAGRSFATVLALMKEFPDYKFMSPQAQLYDYVKRDYPAVYEGIKQAVKEKRWEPEGSMWVESDTNVISGESLVRQFLFGKGFFEEEFGVENKIMWLPDVFGYSGALPQIMAKSGIKYFMTTKIGWCEYNRFPYDTFMWKGIDGTGILSHFIPSRDESDENDFESTYNASLTPRTAYYSWKRYSQKNLNKNYLCSYGHGDGGGGPERSYLENSKRLAEGVPGIPAVKQEFTRDFFERLEKEVGTNKYLPSFKGELYLEYHRGTLTAQARNKKFNRKSEFAMHDAETLCAEALLLNGDSYPKNEINEDWKLILLNQFHDIIPGSSIAPVYEDSKEQYEQVLESAGNIIKGAKSSLAEKFAVYGSSLVVFNTLGFERSEPVIFDYPAGGDITVYDGNEALPTQKTFDGRYVFTAKGVPAKGIKTFEIKQGRFCGEGVAADTKTVETSVYRVDFDENMNISRLFSKTAGRAVSAEGETLGAITAYEDRSHVYEAWDIKCYYDEKSYPVNEVDSVCITEQGAVRTVIKVERSFWNSKITQYYIFTPDGERIDIAYDIDWKEKNIALKADYPVDVNADRATFDIQFGNLERSANDNFLRDFAQFEVCGHKWADLSDSSFGLTVLNDCKYGWTVKDGHIKPTLLRSAANPNVNQDRERHTFVYSLYAHTGEVRNSKACLEGYALNDEMTALCVQGGSAAESSFSLVSADKDNIIIETVKKAEKEDALIIRMYETMNKSASVNVKFCRAFEEISECSLIEKEASVIAADTDSLELFFKPFEIKTLKVKI